jgi:hypothetical protein
MAREQRPRVVIVDDACTAGAGHRGGVLEHRGVLERRVAVDMPACFVIPSVTAEELGTLATASASSDDVLVMAPTRFRGERLGSGSGNRKDRRTDAAKARRRTR